ncbi:methyltransferase domain-containing protein [Spirosoma sp. HMF4905]|uniref:Methyltransferase domain-containing protein n=1 Tax=Spirosoma arboris TaxID=2682092 RepID=A0A7K1S9M2_9BACT|nr:methyltransferase domain-containing protein [Spirosoma arboris]MVM30517.1 methyltransferase domain-containing protein [Spirosoma arboris]
MRAKTNAGGNFNWIAPVYDALAFCVFGHRLQRAQTVFLDRIPPNASLLILGGGSGWLLEQVLLTCRPKQVLYLEASSQMLSLASQRMVRKSLVGSVEFRVGDESSLKSDERFDGIFTPFVLDLFTEQTLASSMIPQLCNVLKTAGVWIVADFVKPKIGWQKALLWTMIRFFQLTAGIQTQRLADWQKLLVEAGLTCEKCRTQVGGMVSAEVWIRP